jgi:hypothetical protein
MRTQLCNTLRSHAAEFGAVAGKGRGQVAGLLMTIEQETAIPPGGKAMTAGFPGAPRRALPPHQALDAQGRSNSDRARKSLESREAAGRPRKEFIDFPLLGNL